VGAPNPIGSMNVPNPMTMPMAVGHNAQRLRYPVSDPVPFGNSSLLFRLGICIG
jgi:hypothetical protein